MEHGKRLMPLVGTFLPVTGVLLTAFLAVVLKDGRRWSVMIIVPLFFYTLCAYFGKMIATDGNLLFVVLSMLYLVVLCIYYPVLTVCGLFLWLRLNNAGGRS